MVGFDPRSPRGLTGPRNTAQVRGQDDGLGLRDELRVPLELRRRLCFFLTPSWNGFFLTSKLLSNFFLISPKPFCENFKNVRCEIPGNLRIYVGDFDLFRTNC